MDPPTTPREARRRALVPHSCLQGPHPGRAGERKSGSQSTNGPHLACTHATGPWPKESRAVATGPEADRRSRQYPGRHAANQRLLRDRHHDVLARPPTGALPLVLRRQVAKIEIESLELLDGGLPPRALRLVKEWAELHQDELRDDWDRAHAHDALLPIDPLP